MFYQLCKKWTKKKGRWWHIGRKRSWGEKQMEWKAGRLTASEQKRDICCLWTCRVIPLLTEVQRIRRPRLSQTLVHKRDERIKCRLAWCKSAACMSERERSRKGDLRWKAKKKKKKKKLPSIVGVCVCECVRAWVRGCQVCTHACVAAIISPFEG